MEFSSDIFLPYIPPPCPLSCCSSQSNLPFNLRYSMPVNPQNFQIVPIMQNHNNNKLNEVTSYIPKLNKSSQSLHTFGKPQFNNNNNFIETIYNNNNNPCKFSNNNNINYNNYNQNHNQQSQQQQQLQLHSYSQQQQQHLPQPSYSVPRSTPYYYNELVQMHAAEDAANNNSNTSNMMLNENSRSPQVIINDANINNIMPSISESPQINNLND